MEAEPVDRVQGRPLDPADLGIGHLFGLVGDAVVAGDATSGRIVLFNPAAEAMFGYAASEAIGLSLEILVSEPLRAAHRAGLARYAMMGESTLVGTGRTVDVPAVRRDGQELWVQLSLSPISSASVAGRFVVAVIRDITERRRAQAELLALADQLEAANRSIRELVLMAAHDLRNPLGVLLGAAGLLSYEELPESARPLVAMIERQSVVLADLVSDLAALGELEEGSVEVKPVNVNIAEMIKDSVETAGLRPADVTVNVRNDGRAWVDQTHLQRILVNLLGNAKKYGRQGIAVFSRNASPDTTEICIADTGPGVPEPFVTHLFEKFSRADPASDQPGRGLGLAIAAGLAELNDGRVWYEPNLPQGSRFWLRVPTIERRSIPPHGTGSPV